MFLPKKINNIFNLQVEEAFALTLNASLNVLQDTSGKYEVSQEAFQKFEREVIEQ